MTAAQNPQVQQLLSQLADINGLDKISWWPLAPGWWAVLVLFAILLLAGIAAGLRRRAFRRSWKHDANETLASMADQLDGINAREILVKLSDLLRRVAIYRFSRAKCAGLKGNEWAQWLTKNDPHKFDWNEYVDILTETPYAPPESMPSPQKVGLLIEATRKWVK
jgi:hypothetical protein